jgi:hypothetical protein
MSQAVYGKLFYNKIEFTNLEAGVTPQFQCPICHTSWQGKLDFGTDFPATFDSNQKPSFTIPVHNDTEGKQCSASDQKIELYIATHKDAKGTRLCIQRSDNEGAGGISANWWVRP